MLLTLWGVTFNLSLYLLQIQEKVTVSFRINSIDLSLCGEIFFSSILGHIFSRGQHEHRWNSLPGLGSRLGHSTQIHA